MENKNATTPPAAGEAAHTPTPWRVSNGRTFTDNAYRITTNGKTPLQIARMFSGRIAGEVTAEQSGANAAFIVRACNSHAALVAALHEAANQLATIAGSEADAHCGLPLGAIQAAADAARSAALNAAKG